MPLKTFKSQEFVFNLTLCADTQVNCSGDEVEYLIWIVQVRTPGDHEEAIKLQTLQDHHSKTLKNYETIRS